MKVYCNECKNLSISWDLLSNSERCISSEVCSKALKVKLPDTYMYQGVEVDEKPSSKNANNNCKDFEQREDKRVS